MILTRPSSRTEEIAVIRMVENSAGRLEPHTYYETDYHTHPEGWSGSSGRQGMPHLSSLYDGALGQNGTFSFFILRRNGEREQYHGCYNLQASVFEMIDENEDGVYEPGEHVLIKNIQVHNTGRLSQTLRNLTLALTRFFRCYALPISHQHTAQYPLITMAKHGLPARWRSFANIYPTRWGISSSRIHEGLYQTRAHPETPAWSATHRQ